MERTFTKQAVIDAFGGPSKVAKALKVTPAYISKWKDGKLIPECRERQIRMDFPYMSRKIKNLLKK